jgi:hypothetical protein
MRIPTKIATLLAERDHRPIKMLVSAARFTRSYPQPDIRAVGYRTLRTLGRSLQVTAMSDEDDHRWQERLKRVAKARSVPEQDKPSLLRSKAKPKKNG